MSGRLAGRVAVITGAGSGIGRAIALRFVAEGADVFGVDMNEATLAETSSEIGNGPGGFKGLVCDLTAEDAPERIVEGCRAAVGAPTILVNNAGIGAAKPVHETTDEEMDRFLDVNLRSVFRLTRSVLEDMRISGGVIIHISSIYGLRGFPTSSIYSTTKAALVGLTQNMAADYGHEGIRVNAIAPGLIHTPLTSRRIENDLWFRDTLLNGTPLGRVGQPHEVAAAALFLASDEESFITGQVLAVDGGWSTTKFAPPFA